MNLLYFNMIVVSVCGFLLIGGFSARERRWGGVAMIAGLIGLMLVIAANIRSLLGG
ncbi:hypothetical protein [Ottowia sp.]|jgi:hypothetical protein|uniref:hypothetical protein n=1 Tax=Ottowia sp. TaxID=1898956 RepID=UPI002C692504|nr:hypothetical protein [Ottowia sp.]HRN74897.1 hypothetical protein [Ottowia sp.]HRQ01770.1 hypothetical protein [Ottowia sp.]